MHSVSCDNMHHNYIDEIFVKIPMLINDNNGLQGNSELGRKIREKRRV